MKVLIMNEDLKKGKLLHESYVHEVETTEKPYFPGEPIATDTDFTNVKMLVPAKKGTILTNRMIFQFKYLRLAISSIGQSGRGSAVAKGKNDEAILEENMDGTFSLTTGRIGVRVGPDKPRTRILPMSEWDQTVEGFNCRGYQKVSTKKNEKLKVKKTGECDPTGDADVDDILSILMTAADMAMQENVTVTVDDISDEQINAAQTVLSDLNKRKDTLSPAAFNARLHDLYIAIPRNVVKPRKMEVHRQKDFEQKIADEQEFLDFIINQVRLARSNKRSAAGITIPEKYGMEWKSVSSDEKDMIQKMMKANAGQYVRAWRVVNKKTEKNFSDYCESKGLTDSGISHLFHGSGTENFFSIATNGLYLNPTGVLISGKAFGHGIYFAPKAQKSIGYTSSSGSYWRKGNADVGYLAIFKVATGEIYDIYGEGKGVPDNYKQLQEKHPGASCTWAYDQNKYAHSYLQNEEVIVYREDQCTIEYLIEFKKNSM